MKKVGCFLIILSIIIILVAIGYKYYYHKPNNTTITNVAEPELKNKAEEMIWGATIRPFAINNNTTEFQEKWIEDQYKFLNQLYPPGAYVRANIEGDPAIDDLTVYYKNKYNNKLIFILEDHRVDFNKDLDFEILATEYTKKIVSKYKGEVEYYQLSNELSGRVFYKPEDTGTKLDAGYGLYMDKTRFENVKRYTMQMAKTIRNIDPEAKIVVTGHWVLIKPITDLINSGLDVDVVGWNWGSGISDTPGIKEVDNYGTMDIPHMVNKLGKDFWIVEANYDDGSTDGQEMNQAQYIKEIATKSKNNPLIKGYFHFTLTDSNEEGPAGELGLIDITQKADGSLAFGIKKPAFYSLKEVAND